MEAEEHVRPDDGAFEINETVAFIVTHTAALNRRLPQTHHGQLREDVKKALPAGVQGQQTHHAQLREDVKVHRKLQDDTVGRLRGRRRQCQLCVRDRQQRDCVDGTSRGRRVFAQVRPAVHLCRPRLC